MIYKGATRLVATRLLLAPSGGCGSTFLTSLWEVAILSQLYIDSNFNIPSNTSHLDISLLHMKFLLFQNSILFQEKFEQFFSSCLDLKHFFLCMIPLVSSLQVIVLLLTCKWEI